MIMHPNSGLLNTAEVNYEQWRDLLRPNWGLYTVNDPSAFVGKVRSRSIYGFNTSDMSSNDRGCERTQQDIRRAASTTSMPYFRFLDV